jgi:hypothetical protein
MGKEIRIIKKDNHNKFEDYTFIDYNNIEAKKIDNENDDGNSTTSSNDKKHKEHDFKLRNNPKKDWKAYEKKRSRLVGGHNIQSHSSVYE